MTSIFFVQCIIKQLSDSVFVISRVIKVSVRVISLSPRVRLITLNFSLIISGYHTSSETQGQLVGAGKRLKQVRKKFEQKKVMNAKKRPAMHCVLDFSSPEFLSHPIIIIIIIIIK